ncbi:alpha/beta hydrolase fold protein [Tanacetum coccineum]
MSTQQNPGIEQQKITIQNNHDEKLVGLLHETGSKEIVILCHGFQCTKEYSMIMELAFALEKQGISAFRFDFSGNGLIANFKAGTSPLSFKKNLNYLVLTRESEGSFQFGNYRKEVDDLHTVIEHFTTANRAVCAILGHSKGGNVVVLYASSHHDIPIVVNVSGRYKMDRGIEERLGKDYLERAKRDGYIDIKSKTGKVLFRATEESILERLNTNMHEAGLKIDKDCKVLTVHGSEDEVIPVEDAFELWDTETGEELLYRQGHSGSVYGLAFHPDGSLAASCGLGALARVWDLPSGRSILALEGHVKLVRSSTDFKPVKVLSGHESKVTFVDIAAHGQSIATVSYDRTIKLCSTEHDERRNDIVNSKPYKKTKVPIPSVTNVELRKPTTFEEDDEGLIAMFQKPNVSYKVNTEQEKERVTDMTMVRKPEPLLEKEDVEEPVSTEESLTEIQTDAALLQKPEPSVQNDDVEEAVNDEEKISEIQTDVSLLQKPEISVDQASRMKMNQTLILRILRRVLKIHSTDKGFVETGSDPNISATLRGPPKRLDQTVNNTSKIEKEVTGPVDPVPYDNAIDTKNLPTPPLLQVYDCFSAKAKLLVWMTIQSSSATMVLQL